MGVSCKPFQTIIIQEPQEVRIQSATITKMNLTVQLPIHNPNFYPIRVKKLQAVAYINQNAVGDITNTETLKIPGNSDKVQSLQLEVDYSDIFDSGFSLRKILRNKNLQLKLDGEITVKSFLMKKKIQFEKHKSIDFND